MRPGLDGHRERPQLGRRRGDCPVRPGALLAGLGPDEIRDDVASRWAGRFGEVSVEVARGLLTYRANVLAVALPAPALAAPPRLAAEEA